MSNIKIGVLAVVATLAVPAVVAASPLVTLPSPSEGLELGLTSKPARVKFIGRFVQVDATDHVLQNTDTTIDWWIAGTKVHSISHALIKGDDPGSFTIRMMKDNQKALVPPIDVVVTFSDDDTFSFKDPFATSKDKALTLVWKRQ